MTSALLTYHAIGDGPAPLWVSTELFERHLGAIRRSGASVVTVAEAGARMRSGQLDEPFVAITFDDGFAHLLETALPALARAELSATVFAVAGHLGGLSDWSSQPDWAPRLPVLGADGLARLRAAGWEIGAHGVGHDSLASASPETIRAELAGSRATLEDAIGDAVTSFAWPFGHAPREAAGLLSESGYRAGCTGALGVVDAGSDALAMPRIDAHYVRHPSLLAAVLEGRAPGYLGARRLAARVRRSASGVRSA